MIFSRAPHLSLILVLTRTFVWAQDENVGGAQFLIVNGQIYTPGLAIIDAPQPNTPEGGDSIQVAMDISGDGRIPQPPYPSGIESGIFNITVFLTSYQTGLNLTISNGTSAGWVQGTTEDPAYSCPLNSAGSGAANARRDPDANVHFAADSSQTNANAGCVPVMEQEPGSTVKHVNWVWPDCMVGNGGASIGTCGNGGTVQDCLTPGSARGEYNISIHQAFRLNGASYYTIFDLPIQVTNSISGTTSSSSSGARPLCALRNNPLQSPDQQISSVTSLPFQPYLGGDVSSSGGGSGGGGSGSGSGGSGSGGSGGGSGSGGSGSGGSGDGGSGDGGTVTIFTESPTGTSSILASGSIPGLAAATAGPQGVFTSQPSPQPTESGTGLKDLIPSGAGAVAVQWAVLGVGLGLGIVGTWWT